MPLQGSTAKGAHIGTPARGPLVGLATNPTRAERVLRDIGYSGSRLLGERASELSPLDVAELLGVKVDRLDQVLAELRDGGNPT